MGHAESTVSRHKDVGGGEYNTIMRQLDDINPAIGQGPVAKHFFFGDGVPIYNSGDETQGLGQTSCCEQ